MNGLDITQLGIAGAVVIVVVMFLNYMKAENDRRDIRDRELANAMKENSESTRQNSQLTKEVSDYLKLRNGSGDRLMKELSDKMDKYSQATDALVDKVKQ